MSPLQHRALTSFPAVRTLFVLTLLLLAPTSARAQEVSVTIRVEDSSGPVEGVDVTAANVTTPTDAAGQAQFTLLLGEHPIRAERIGYAPAETTLVLTSAVDTLVVLVLTPEAVEAEGIMVSSARTVRRIEDEPLRVEVVSREEVEEKLLMTPGDIAMLLNETAGLRVQPTVPALGGASVRIQGLRGRYTQILSDGLPLYGGQAGALGPLQVPPMDLAQVEVIKGAASALYGPTALGGVVNLISRRPQPERELLLNVSTLGGADGVGWLADDLTDRWGYTLLAGAHGQDYADVDNDGWADVPRFTRVAARPRVFWDDGAGRSANITVGAMWEDREGGTVPDRVTPEGEPYREALDTRRVDAGFLGRTLINDRLSLSGRGAASFQSHDHRQGDRQERDQHITSFAELVLSGQAGRHLWLVGAAFQTDRYDAEDVPIWSFDFLVPALFLQDEFDLSDRVTVAGSMRFDHHSEYGGALSPRVSLLTRNAGWVLRASGGAGFFGPTPFTDETEAAGLSRLVPSDPWVKERAWSAMLDVGRTVGPVEINGSVFGSRINDPIQTLRHDDGTLTIQNAAESVRTWGAEVFAALHQGSVHVVGSYTYLRSTEPIPSGGGRREVPLTPQHAVGVVGAYEQAEGRIGVELYYTGVQSLDDDPYRSTSVPNVILGLLVDRRFGAFRVFLNAENLLDTRQTRWDPLVRPGQAPDGRWTTDAWAPLDGRSFNGGVWISF
jgi:outer membrane receptor for ferrienterochelin and colicins